MTVLSVCTLIKKLCFSIVTFSFFYAPIALSNNESVNSGLSLGQYKSQTYIKSYATSFNSTNIQPISDILKDNWKGGVSKSSDFGLSQSKVGIELVIKNWRLVYETRNDHFLTTNESSARLYQYAKTSFLATKSSYDLNIHYRKLQAKGVKLGYTWQPIKTFSMTNYFGVWRPTTVRNSHLLGDVVSEGTVTGVAQLEEWYSYKNLLKRQIGADWGEGTGKTWDLVINWQPTENLILGLDIFDLFSKFDFDHLGYSSGTLNSSTTYRDEDNILRFNPAYSGVESEKPFSWDLPKSISLTASYAKDDIEYLLAINKRDLNTSIVLGAGFDIAQGVITSGYDIRNKAIKVVYSNSWFEGHIMTDNLDISDAKTFSLSLSANLKF